MNRQDKIKELKDYYLHYSKQNPESYPTDSMPDYNSMTDEQIDDLLTTDAY